MIFATLLAVAFVATAFGVLSWVAGGGALLRKSDQSGEASDQNNRSSSSAANSFDASISVPSGLFPYGGSTTWIPIHEPLNQSISSTFPEFQLRYTLPADGRPGSGAGIQMLMAGQLAFAESSRPLKDDEYSSAEQRGFSLEQIPVAIDGIALAVHPDLDVNGLTVSQIQAIYRGEATNWSEIGGPDLPIQAVSRDPEASGTAKFFLEEVIGAEVYGDDVDIVADLTSGVRQVSQTPGGIFYGSAPEIVEQCSIFPLPIAPSSDPQGFVSPVNGFVRQNEDCEAEPNQINRQAFREGSYPFTRQLFVVVKDNDTDEEAAGRAYGELLLSPHGQALIEQSGFVGIR